MLAVLKSGDYVIIQFGHNDEKTNDVKRGTAPFGEFTTNLVRFIRESRDRAAPGRGRAGRATAKAALR